MRSNHHGRSALIAAAAAAALVFASAAPAFADERNGSRSCNAPKSVSITSQLQGTSGYHYYLATGQTFNFTLTNPDVAFVKTSYSAALSSNYKIYATKAIYAYSASCF